MELSLVSLHSNDILFMLTKPQMSPAPLAGVNRPYLLSVEVDIPAVERVEGVGQHASLPIKWFAVAVVPEGRNRNFTFDFVFLLN